MPWAGADSVIGYPIVTHPNAGSHGQDWAVGPNVGPESSWTLMPFLDRSQRSSDAAVTWAELDTTGPASSVCTDAATGASVVPFGTWELRTGAKT